MKKAQLFILYLLLLVRCTPTDAQAFRVFAHRYNMESGLPHRQINALLEDHRGLIWAATGAGIVRFDGTRFITLTKTEHGLASAAYQWLTEDAAGYIWAIAYNSGQRVATIDIIDPVSCTVIPNAAFFKNYPIPSSAGQMFIQARQGANKTLYFGLSAPAGWVSYHPDRGWETVLINTAATEFRVVQITSQNHVWGFLKPAESDQPESLVEFDNHGVELTRYQPSPGNKFKYYDGETGDPNSFFIVENAPDWHNRQFWKIKNDGQREKVEPPVSPAGESTGILALLEHQQIWFNELRMYVGGKIVIDLKKMYPELLENRQVCWLHDSRGRIWVGTAFGLILTDISKDHFRRFLYEEKGQGGTGVACRGLVEQHGFLFVNTDTGKGGRYKIDLKTGVASRIGNSIYSYGLAADATGNIWTDGVAGKGQVTGISKVDPITGNQLPGIPIDAVVWNIFTENNQRFLLGTSKGIYMYFPPSNTYAPIELTGYPELSTTNVVYIGRDRENNIWACAETGFYRIDPGTGRIAERHWTGGTNGTQFPTDDFMHFTQDADGVFWIGTRGAGLLRWDKKTGEQQLLFRRNGILNGNIYAVFEDDFGQLWMPTDYGIVQLDKKSLHVQHTWLVEDGISHDEFNRISFTKGKDGALYFGGLNGVTAFHPAAFNDTINTSKHRFPLVLSDVHLLNNDGQLENQTTRIIQSEAINLYPGDRYLQLEFTLLDYVNTQNVNYSWKIEGIDADWTYTGKPEIRLSSLPAGNYRLLIRAQAADGEWAANDLQFQLHVLAPFYLRWWFLLLVLILAGAAIRYWQKRHQWEKEKLERTVARATAKIGEDKKIIEQQAAELRQINEAKSRFFANISHELRTPLTLMLGPLNSIAHIKNLDPAGLQLIQMATTHGKNLLGLVNEILDLSKLEAGKLELNEVQVVLLPELQQIAQLFENQALQQDIHLVLQLDVNKTSTLKLDVAKLHTILNNLLSNALKFTPEGGTVTLHVSEKGNSLLFKVGDTGGGIHPLDLPHIFDRFYQSNQPGAAMRGGTGIGLALSRELAELMDGRLDVESQYRKGSVFTLEIPKKLVDNDTFAKETPVKVLPLQHTLATNTEDIAFPEDAPMVLIVEDNNDLRQYLKFMLSKQYRVATAANGQLALDWLQTAAGCQLIISDLMMPVMDGHQLLESLKGDDRYRHIPVIMLTAKAETGDKLRALRIGVDDYLIKPFDPEELIARIDNLLLHFNNRSAVHELPEEASEDNLTDENDRQYSVNDLEWLGRFEALVKRSMADFELNAEFLAVQMFTSRSQLFRRVKQLTGLNVSEYIQEVRFQQARTLLEAGKHPTVKAVALSVGFKHVNNFAINYKKRFGKAPSQYF